MITHSLKWIAAASVLCLALTGCSSNAVQTVDAAPHNSAKTIAPSLSESKLDSTSLNQATPQQITQLLVVWVAGYCQGWADATGESFERCFNLTTEQTLKTFHDRTGMDLTAEAAAVVDK